MLKIIQLYAMICVYFGQNPAPFYTFNIDYPFIFHEDEVLFYIRHFVQTISQALVLKDFGADAKFTAKISIGVAVGPPAQKPPVESISLDFQAGTAQFKNGTGEELEAFVPEIEEKVAYAILKAIERK